jgi:predicted nucleic acid-binding protein
MGLNLFLDTNAIIALLQNSKQLLELTSRSSAIYISVISELEFKSFPNLTTKDHQIFEAFVKRVSVINLKHDHYVLKNKIIELRKNHKMKLPDAIIAASAITINASLVTADKGFAKIDSLTLINWNEC